MTAQILHWNGNALTHLPIDPDPPPVSDGEFTDASGTQASPSERIARLPGPNTHWDYTSYKSHAPGGNSAIADQIIAAGFRHHRDHADTDGEAPIDRLAAAGVNWCPTLAHAAASSSNGTLQGYLSTTRLNRMRNRIANIDVILGINESDNMSWTSAQIRDSIIYCDKVVRQDGTLGTRPVTTPSWTFPENSDVQGVGDITAYVDGTDFHPYPGFHRGEWRNGSHGGVVDELNAALNLISDAHSFSPADWDFLDSGDHCVVASETGWHNNYPAGGGSYSPGHHGCPRDVAAAYGPALCAYYDSLGIARLHFYEAINQSTAKGGETSSSNQGSFGLMEQDLTWKPLMHAMSNFLDIVGDPGDPFVPGLLDYTISGTSSTRHRLYQKRDGTFLLAIWQDVLLWDYTSQSYTAPSDVSVSVTLNQRGATTRTLVPYKIGGGNSTVTSASTSRTQGAPFAVAANGWLTLLEIT